MKIFTPEVIKTILKKHLLFLKEETGGECADLSGVNLSSADLSDADLRSVNLRSADLSGVNLSGVNLSSANLYGADLSGANLYGANLYSANLYGADLSGVNLSSADLAGVKRVRYAQVAWTGHGECGRQLLGVVINGEPRYFCGCFQGNADDLQEYIQTGLVTHKASRTKAFEFVQSCLDEASNK